jgi:gluconate 2-dehydrogenase gamma chain
MFRILGVAGAVTALPAGAQSKTERPKQNYVFFNPAEAAFIEAAVDRLIPSDDSGPGAREAGVAFYIDRQLAGAWGAGERLYRSGPWQPGKPSQGYQLPFTPSELFRNALGALIHRPPAFAHLSPTEQDAFLDKLQKSEDDLGGVPAAVFFESLLEATMEGFFSDPAYGGNRDMVGWRLIGFPGAYADYYEWVDRHGLAYTLAPTSLAEGDGKKTRPNQSQHKHGG